MKKARKLKMNELKALIKEELSSNQGIETVRDLISALSKFSRNLPILELEGESGQYQPLRKKGGSQGKLEHTWVRPTRRMGGGGGDAYEDAEEGEEGALEVVVLPW